MCADGRPTNILIYIYNHKWIQNDTHKCRDLEVAIQRHDTMLFNSCIYYRMLKMIRHIFIRRLCAHIHINGFSWLSSAFGCWTRYNFFPLFICFNHYVISIRIDGAMISCIWYNVSRWDEMRMKSQAEKLIILSLDNFEILCEHLH